MPKVGTRSPGEKKASKRKTIHRQIGGAISMNEPLLFSDGTIGRYAGTKKLTREGLTIDIYKDSLAGEILSYLPETIRVNRQTGIPVKYQTVERPEIIDNRSKSFWSGW